MNEAEAKGSGVWLMVGVALLAVCGQGLAAYYLLRDGEVADSSPPAPARVEPSAPPPPPATASPLESVTQVIPLAETEPEVTPDVAKLPPEERAEALLEGIRRGLRRQRDGGLAPDQDLATAQADVEAALALAPERPGALGLLAEVILAQGEPGGALPFARRAAAADPEDPRLRLLLAECLVSLGQANMAGGDLSYVLLWTKDKTEPSDRLLRARAMVQTARCWIQEEKFEDALIELEKARETSPAPLAWVEFYTGYVYQRMRVHLRGLPHYTTALRLDPNHGDGYYFRATLQFDLGAYAEALADLERALELHEQGIPHRYREYSAYYVLGRTLEKVGRWQGAHDAFERYLQEAPGGEVGASSQHAHEALIRLRARLGHAPPR